MGLSYYQRRRLEKKIPPVPSASVRSCLVLPSRSCPFSGSARPERRALPAAPARRAPVRSPPARVVVFVVVSTPRSSWAARRNPLPPPRSQYHAERIRDVFTQLDVNGKGILSFDEIRLGLEREGFDWVRLASESFPSAMTLRAIRPRATSPSSASRRVGASLVAVPLPLAVPILDCDVPVPPSPDALTAPPSPPPQKKLRSRSRTSTGRR